MKKIAFLQSGKALAVEPVQSTANRNEGRTATIIGDYLVQSAESSRVEKIRGSSHQFCGSVW